MSLHFQVDIAFDFREDTPEDIICGLENLAHSRPLTEQQKQCLPKMFESEITGMTGNLSFVGRDVYYFKKHYRCTRNGTDIYKWTFHFRTMLSDDVFYEEGYPLLAWLALYSDTNGFVGYIREEFDEESRLLYFGNGEVRLKESVDKEIRFKYSDFEVKY